LNPVEFGAVGDGIANDAVPIQALLDRLATGRGGKLCLPPVKFRLPVSLRIRSKSISIDGGANGFSNSPNAEHESQTGSVLKCAGDGFLIGNHDPALVSAGAHKLGGINLRDLYLWGPGSSSAARAFVIDHDIDQSQISNVHIGNFGWGWLAESVMDAVTILDLDVIHCRTGMEVRALSVYVRLCSCIFCDNDGAGLIVRSEGRSFGWVISDCVIIRNARVAGTEEACNILFGADESTITGNIIQDAGHHFYNQAVLGQSDVFAPASGLVLTGARNLITANQFQEHCTGPAIVVRGRNNQLLNNVFRGNQTDIVVEAEAQDTVIVQHGKLKIVDRGVRTVVNNVGGNQGDPDHAGDWRDIPKWDGLILHNTVGGTTWIYGSTFPGGRIAMRSPVSANEK